MAVGNLIVSPRFFGACSQRIAEMLKSRNNRSEDFLRGNNNSVLREPRSKFSEATKFASSLNQYSGSTAPGHYIELDEHRTL